MALTSTERKRKSRANKAQKGLKRVEVYVANNKEAEVDLKMYVSYLNQKYNMMKIGE
jgi:hypothetical protein